MNPSFTPTFGNFQRDVEQYLRNAGKVGRNEHGQTVFHGYEAARDLMFRSYLQRGAHAPLVAELRTWNWEWGYNDILMEVTDRLTQAGDWSLLRALWGAVIARRRTNYNKTRKAQRSHPAKIPEALVDKTRELLLESLYRLRTYAADLGRSADFHPYAEMIGRVERRVYA